MFSFAVSPVDPIARTPLSMSIATLSPYSLGSPSLHLLHITPQPARGLCCNTSFDLHLSLRMRTPFFERRVELPDPRGEEAGELGDGEFLTNARARTVEEGYQELADAVEGGMKGKAY